MEADAMPPATPEPEQLTHLRELPFVKELRFVPPPQKAAPGADAELHVQTDSGRFRFLVQIKRSYLEQTALYSLVARAEQARREKLGETLLLARHISRPMAERLISEHIGFADTAGNVHLQLGARYNWTVMGRPEPQPLVEERRTTPAHVQLLFQFASNPDSLTWPVRQLENAAGVGRTKAAQGRNRILSEELFLKKGKRYEPGPFLTERLVTGYGQLLRPKLLLHRFGYPEKSPEAFLDRLRVLAPQISLRYALTGAPAAGLLQHFYRGLETPLFVDHWNRNTQNQLRLLPDRQGPLTILHAFGEVIYWREIGGHTIAPPWLIYAELANSRDPRAHEAAEHLRREYLL
jgi:hypothetical protein